MARSIPTYERKVIATGIQGGGRATSAVAATDPAMAGLASLGESVGKLAQTYGAMQKHETENRAAVDVANVLSQGEVYWQQNFTERAKAWQPGGEDMREGIGKDFDKWAAENEQKLPTEAAKQYFRLHSVKMRTNMQTNAYSYQEKATTDKLNADTVVAEQADENTVYGDANRYDEVYRRRAEVIAARTDLSDAEKIRQADVYKRKLSLAVERGQMERDPIGWYKQRFGDPGKAGAPMASGAPATGSGAIAQAIYGQESSSGQADTSRVNSQNVTGPMQMQKGTFDGMKKLGLIPNDFDWKNPEQNKEAGFKWVDHLSQKYNGDPAKVAAAYYGGEGAVAEDGTIKRHWRNKQRPSDPTVGEYVDQVVGRMQKQSAGGVATATAAVAPTAPNAPATFSRMDWEQQSALRAAAESRIKQEETKVFAGVVASTSSTAVAAQPIGNDLNVDLQKAKDDALAAAKNQFGRDLDEGQRAQVEQAVERAASVRERDRKRMQDNTAQAVFDALDQNGGDYQALQQSMAGDLSKLPRDVQVRAQRYAGAVATGETRPTDWVAYTQLVDNPKLLMSTNLPALRDKFSSNEYAQLTKLQDSTRKAVEAGMPDQTIMGDMALVKSMLADAGIKSNAKEGQFFSALQREMDARRAATGQKNLKQSEVKEIANDLLMKEITHKGILWDTKERAFELEVPAPERAKITAALNEAGIPVNDGTILRAYRNKLNRSQQSASGTVASPR